MTMPSLRPLPIKTKMEFPWVRAWRWITFVRQWELVEDWVYELPGTGRKVVIPKGFVFDGASIPKPLWALLAPTGLLLVPGLIHDFAYRYDYLWSRDESGEFYKYRDGAGQRVWDKIFYQVGFEVNGMSSLNVVAWAALALGGRFAWRSNRKRNAPEVFPTPVKGVK